MKTLEFSELQQVFHNAEVWCSGYEKYWFEHAWNVLTRQGMTGFDNSREYYEVWIRAVALARVYHQFCGMAFDENTEPYYTDYIDDEVPMLVVAQLLGSRLPKDEICEENESELLLVLVDIVKFEVFQILSRELSEADVYAWMYCTGDSSYFDDEDINSLQEYSDAVSRATKDVVDDDVSGADVDAYDFICRLMRPRKKGS